LVYKDELTLFVIGGFGGSVFTGGHFTFENNTNNGSIEGSHTYGTVATGGFIGHFDENGKDVTAIIRGNTNTGLIDISYPAGTYSFYAGGIIGLVRCLGEFIFKDNANYGNVISNSDTDVVVCGLFCQEIHYTENIENCINNGTIEGPKAYGISGIYYMKGNNVVSMGIVKGKSISYSFWKSISSSPALYGMNGSCVNCDKSVKLFALNESDGRYRTVNDNSDLVELLNEEAEKKGYYMRWDDNLVLYIPVTIHIHIESPIDMDFDGIAGRSLGEFKIPDEVFKYHLFAKGTDPTPSNEMKKTSKIEEDIVLVPYYMMTIKGVIDRIFYVEAVKHGEFVFDNVKALKQYVGTKDYAIGDSEHHSVLSEQSTITGDMEILVMHRNVVLIDVDESTSFDVNDVNKSEIAQTISDLTGISVSEILVDFECDEHGVVNKVIIIMNDIDKCKKTAEAVNEFSNSDCESSNILCHSRAHVHEDERSSISYFSLSIRNYIHYASMLLFVLVLTSNI